MNVTLKYLNRDCKKKTKQDMYSLRPAHDVLSVALRHLLTRLGLSLGGSYDKIVFTVLSYLLIIGIIGSFEESLVLPTDLLLVR